MGMSVTHPLSISSVLSVGAPLRTLSSMSEKSVFFCLTLMVSSLLPPRASEQGNVIGSVRIYICVQKKIVIERTRDLIYLKFVATDFFPKIISPSAGENSGDLA